VRLKGPFRKLFAMSKRDHGHHVQKGGLEYDVPFVHQNHVNLCADASAQMVILFNERPATLPMKLNVGHKYSYRLRRNPRGILEGGNGDYIVAMIQAAGLQAWKIRPLFRRWTAESVRSALEIYGPYAQSVRFSVGYHRVVVTGTDGLNVIYHDPWRGRNMSKTIGDWVIAADGEDLDSAVAATEEGYVESPYSIVAEAG